MKGETIKSKFEELCETYLKLFCQKHGLDYEKDSWIGQTGTNAMIGDYYINFHDVRYDIDNACPKETYLEWYDYDMRCAVLECPKKINYPSWVKGAPRPYTEAELTEIEELWKRVEDATREFREYISKK